MALKGQMSLCILAFSFLALQHTLLNQPSSGRASGIIGARMSNLRSASREEVSSTIAVRLKAVSILNAGVIPVVQQPSGNTNFVSRNDGEVTQFASASLYGNVGLLAHNYLSGRRFSNIRIGQEIHLVYSNGDVEDFIVTEIIRYKALEPRSPYSSFQNLDDPDEILTVGQMFNRAYAGGRHVTLQTCIPAEGISSWGRLFVIATPKLETLGFGAVIPVKMQESNR